MSEISAWNLLLIDQSFFLHVMSVRRTVRDTLMVAACVQ